MITSHLKHDNMLEIEHMDVAFTFYENRDFNPQLVINFHHNVPGFQFNFPNAK